MQKLFSPLRILVLLAAFIVSLQVFPQFSKKLPSNKPRLIITIVIDPFSFDQLNRYQDKLEKNGLRKLMAGGSFFRNARYNYFFTEAETGIATLVSGTNPDIHGIVGQNWFEPLHNHQNFCTADDGVKAVGGSYKNGKHSPAQLLSSTIGDEIRLSSRFKSKVFGVSLYPDNAVLLAGHLANGAYWFDDITGTWMSSSFYMDSLPGWVTQFNQKDLTRTYLQKKWEPLLPLTEYTASLPDTSDYHPGILGKNKFPYDLKKLSGAGHKKENLSLIRYTPYGNTLTEDFITNLILNEQLGKDDACDFLGISFSASRDILEAFGPMSMEAEDAVLRLDHDIANLLTFADKEIGKENTLIVLTSSHGIAPDPEYMQTLQMPSGYFNPNQAMALLRSYLNVIYGEGSWVKGYHNHQIYLDHMLIEDANLSLYKMEDKVADFILQFSGVSNVMTAHSLRESGSSNPLFIRIQNGFSPKRSGDIIVILYPGWQEKNEHMKASGSGFWDNTHVPLIWYGWKMPKDVIYHSTDLNTVAPTLSYFLQIPAPNGSEGSLIEDLLEVKNK